MSVRRNITIRDIAKRASVSISTVSRVLNNPESVSEEKQRAVLDAVEALNYRPNVSARGLASGQSMTIGVLTQYVNSPHFGTMTRGILQGLDGSGYSVIFSDGSFDPDIERRVIDNLLNRNVDGLIVLEGSLSDAELVELNEHIPLVVAGRRIETLEHQCLFLDQFTAAETVTQYLIDMGHRHIAHIVGIPEHQDTIDRREGYLHALRQNGIPVNEQLMVQGDFQEQSGLLAVEMLMTRGNPFTAIFAANDQMAYGARLALYRRGIRVPGDVSLIGFDDQTPSAYATPPLTTMRQPSLEMGEAAAETLVNVLNGSQQEPPSFSGELIIRESVARHR